MYVFIYIQGVPKVWTYRLLYLNRDIAKNAQIDNLRCCDTAFVNAEYKNVKHYLMY